MSRQSGDLQTTFCQQICHRGGSGLAGRRFIKFDITLDDSRFDRFKAKLGAPIEASSPMMPVKDNCLILRGI